jgi:Cu/Ag efflux protein CusF
MKKVIAIVVCSLFVFTIPLISRQVGTNEAAAASAKKSKSSEKKLMQVSGEVTAVNRETKSITVGGVSIIVDDNSLLANIKEGDSLTVEYTNIGGNRAFSITPEPR